ICVIGLGYVGLPLAVGLAERFHVVGFDINSRRITELTEGLDRNHEVEAARLRQTRLQLTSDARAIEACDVYIVTVPTPVDPANRPDLSAVRAACRTIGPAMRAGAVVVLE